MAAAVRVNSLVGSLYYIPEDHDTEDQPLEAGGPPESFRPRPRRHNSVRVASLPEETPQPKRNDTDSSLIRRLSNGRDNAKRFLRSVISPPDWHQAPQTAEEAAVLELLTGVRVPPRVYDRSRSSSSSSAGPQRQSSSRQQRELDTPRPRKLRRQLSSRRQPESRPSSSSQQESPTSSPSSSSSQDSPTSSPSSSSSRDSPTSNPSSASPQTSPASDPSSSPPRVSPTSNRNTGASRMSAGVAASRRHTVVGAPIGVVLARPSLSDNVRNNSQASAQSSSSDNSSAQIGPTVRLDNEAPIASSNGVSLYISLAEPILYLQGFEQNDVHSRTTSMLRGSLLVRVTKPSKLKTISLKFKGKARTEWPEGKSGCR